MVITPADRMNSLQITYNPNHYAEFWNQATPDIRAVIWRHREINADSVKRIVSKNREIESWNRERSIPEQYGQQLDLCVFTMIGSLMDFVFQQNSIEKFNHAVSLLNWYLVSNQYPVSWGLAENMRAKSSENIEDQEIHQNIAKDPQRNSSPYSGVNPNRDTEAKSTKEDVASDNENERGEYFANAILQEYIGNEDSEEDKSSFSGGLSAGDPSPEGSSPEDSTSEDLSSSEDSSSANSSKDSSQDYSSEEYSSEDSSPEDSTSEDFSSSEDSSFEDSFKDSSEGYFSEGSSNDSTSEDFSSEEDSENFSNDSSEDSTSEEADFSWDEEY
ncbi:predicted protein [Histoplasma mississippiense (nom. inval.)]|uniref:predicted protein n=1 Tax=Ajellomyces capsulatus (strain NAm1 / WU24) TaxID=2059318 RepID=UPI000157CEE8|nr:predicted protein [Histoplasma mississippiense (nom. inval.)]EDN11151.1 predicted protein [Histoplasma mississippiense (nom. inval.)]